MCIKVLNITLLNMLLYNVIIKKKNYLNLKLYYKDGRCKLHKGKINSEM